MFISLLAQNDSEDLLSMEFSIQEVISDLLHTQMPYYHHYLMNPIESFHL